ncbi:MAG TPA: hypothetical protein VFD58_33440 [Blastocatellia bacterium]|nr:hypothetical protein [Blastocatellia bacterium]
MKQYEAVIQTLEKLGGQATLAELYREVLKIGECNWQTKTPFASIRRIVQVRPEIFRVRPGLWALRSHQSKLGLVEQKGRKQPSAEAVEQGHSYYQGLLVVIGNLRNFSTFVPNQDKNKPFINQKLRDVRTLQKLPAFSYDNLVNRSGTIDVTWFNQRQMPHSFFEVEHSTDIQNSLLKFYELQDFHAQMVIVADEARRTEFEHKIRLSALDAIKERVEFLGYNRLVRQYEYEILRMEQGFFV